MKRLTRKMMGKVMLPIIPLEIRSKEDLEKYHKARVEYEDMAIKLAEYEDREDMLEEQRLNDMSNVLDAIADFIREYYLIKRDQDVEVGIASLAGVLQRMAGEIEVNPEKVNKEGEELFGIMWEDVFLKIKYKRGVLRC